MKRVISLILVLVGITVNGQTIFKYDDVSITGNGSGNYVFTFSDDTWNYISDFESITLSPSELVEFYTQLEKMSNCKRKESFKFVGPGYTLRKNSGTKLGFIHLQDVKYRDIIGQPYQTLYPGLVRMMLNQINIV